MKKSLLLCFAFLLLMGMFPVHAQRTILVSNVRRIYIEKMPDNLDQYLASAISRKMHGTVTVVLSRSEADAILRGINIGAQTTAQATVQLVDPSEREVIWSGTGGDRKVLTLGIAHGGQDKIADRLIGELKKAMSR